MKLAGSAAVLLSLVAMATGPAPAGASSVPIFGTPCLFSHRAPDDPIVSPGKGGAAHSHDFFGSFSTDAHSSPDSLRARAGTSCHRALDRAAYWVPTLYQDGRAVTPEVAQVYYRGLQRDLRTVRPPPAGLKVIAGSARATGPQRGIVSWGCVPGENRATVPQCTGGTLRLRIHFPDCWDGRNLDSADHAEHMAYSEARRCPGAHPVPVPRIELNVVYPTPGGSGVTLASGAASTAHADFMNGWHQNELARLVRTCIHEIPSTPQERCTGPEMRDLPPAPTLAPIEGATLFGGEVALRGSMAPAAPLRLEVEQRTGWREIGSVLAGPDGKFALAFSPTSSARYRAMSDAGRQSEPVAVSVTPRIRLALRGRRRTGGSTAVVPAGSTVRATVNIAPAKRLVILRLERRAGGRWVSAGRRGLGTRRGRAVARLRLRRAGRYRVRAVTPADDSHAAGRSAPQTVLAR